MTGSNAAKLGSDVVALRPDRPPLSLGGGDGTYSDMERRITALEDGQKAILATLEKLRDGQQSAALAAVDQKGILATALAEVSGKLTNISTLADGLRRDIDKLPSKFDVATIMVLVIGGLGGIASIIKIVWPRAFGG